MRLSFSLVPDPARIGEYVTAIREAEAAGFSMVWTPDQGFMSDPFVPIGIASQATSSIELGLGITSVFMRHPMQIARAAGTLSNVSGGRFVLALGAGEKARIRDAIGAPGGGFVPMTREAIAVIRKLLAGEKVTAEHEAFSMAGAGLEFTVDHNIPIHVATTAPDAFRMAGECADGVIVGDVSDPSVMKQIVAWIGEGAASANRDMKDIEIVSWASTIVTDEPDEIRRRMRRPVAGTALVGMNRQTRALFNVDEAHIPAIKNARRNPDAPLPDNAITDEMIDGMALIGSADKINERISQLSDVGVTMMGFRMPVALRSYVDFPENIRKISKEIVPNFRNGKA